MITGNKLNHVKTCKDRFQREANRKLLTELSPIWIFNNACWKKSQYWQPQMLFDGFRMEANEKRNGWKSLGGNSCVLICAKQELQNILMQYKKKTNRYCQRREINYKHNVNKI